MSLTENDNIEKIRKVLDEIRVKYKIDLSEYFIPILGLIFIKYLDYRFLIAERELDKRGKSLEAGDKLYYKNKGIMYIPDSAKFYRLISFVESENIGWEVDKTIEVIENENHELKGFFPKEYKKLKYVVISKVLNLLSEISIDDTSGKIFEKLFDYVLNSMFKLVGKERGNYFTPSTLSNLLIKLLEPKIGSISDPACGSGGMLLSATKFAQKSNKKAGQKLEIYGQEIDTNIISLCKMNLMIHGVTGNIQHENIFYQNSDENINKFNYIISNPPFNLNGVDAENIKNSSYFPFGIPAGKSANYLWIQQFYSSLNENGRAGFIMPNSANDSTGSELEIRKRLIQDQVVDVMISIAPKFLYGTPIPCTLWFLDKGKKNSERGNKVLFIDAEKLYAKADESHLEFTDEHIEYLGNIVNMYKGKRISKVGYKLKEDFPNCTYVDVPGLCKVVDINEIKAQEWSLNPKNYMDLEKDKKDIFKLNQVCEQAISFLKKEGYEISDSFDYNVNGNSLIGRENSSEVVLTKFLRDKLKRLNPLLDKHSIEKAIEMITKDRSGINIVDINLEIHMLLKHGVVISKDGHEKGEIVRIIDWDKMENNHFFVASNFIITDKIGKRCIDLICFVNGIPFILLELKSRSEEFENHYKVRIAEFKDTIPKLFWYNAMIILSNGTQSYIGSMSASWRRFFEWNKNNSEGKKTASSLEEVIKGICSKKNLLDIVENFTLFNGEENYLEKTIARDYQCFGVNRALRSIDKLDMNKGKLGVIYQAQDFGRIQSMIFFVQKVLRKRNENWTFLIVTDTHERLQQLSDSFTSAKTNTENIMKVGNRNHLQKYLNYIPDLGICKIMFISIQAFLNSKEGYPKISDRKNIIVIVDTPNMSQYNTYAQNMKIALPNASFICFTGVPIAKADTNTRQLFGEYLNIYSLEQSIADGVSLPIHYEGRPQETQVGIKHFNDVSNTKNDELEYDKKSKELWLLNSIIDSDNRQKIIAKDIVHHFMNREYMGKAMVISNSISEAEFLHQIVQEYWNKYMNNLDKKIATCKSEEANELEEKLAFMRQTEMAVITSKNRCSDTEMLRERYRDPNEPLRLVFVCSMWITDIDVPNLNTVYLDRPVNTNLLMQIISRTNRPFQNKTHGTIVDYIGIRSKFDEIGVTEKVKNDNSEFNDISISNDTSVNRIELVKELAKLEKFILEGIYSRGRECLRNIININENKGKKIEKELAFLYNLNRNLQDEEKYWSNNKTDINLKCRLWIIMSENSSFQIDKIEHDNECSISETEEDKIEEKDSINAKLIPKENDHLKPVEKGKQLELSVLELFEKFFNICEENKQEILEKVKLRRQNSGNQFGFDIDFTYLNKANEKVNCVVECKNYGSSIKFSDILPKLEEARLSGREIEHWILISPKATVDNEVNIALDSWEEEVRWYPIKKVQVWTPETDVDKFLGIVPDIYDAFYSHENAETHPRKWSAEVRIKNIEYWKMMLQSSIILSKKWKEYLRDPNKLLYKNEDDPDTVQVYSMLYQNYVTMKCLDEDGKPLDKILDQYLRSWLDKKSEPTKILLGEFGDGKTFFTYTFSRKLIKEFIESPELGWIPIRFTLQDYGKKGDSQDFIERRLKRFGVTFDSWNEVKRNYKVLIILDGFDEMSLSLDNMSIDDNIKRLVECCKEFKGLKVLITSRKAFFANKIKRNELMNRIGAEEIIQIAPIGKVDKLIHLEQCAKTPDEKLKLNYLKEANDPIGLASKPLFLEMVKATLQDVKITDLDSISIYEEYITKSLERKFEEQLENDEILVCKNETIKNMKEVLEDLALILQEFDTESINLEQFKAYSKKRDIAELLWNITSPSKCVEEDANARIAIRSLLKCVNKNSIDGKSEIPVTFCHRSMKEYFVARGICNLLLKDINMERAEKFLKKCYISHEIVVFASQFIRKYMGIEQKELYVQKLISLIQKTKYKNEDEDRNDFARLGCNCVNLLYEVQKSLPGDDWSNLLLDNAYLHGANLSSKTFSYTSLRYANLDNVDFSNADFRFSDLTGVRIEETHEIESIAVQRETDKVYAIYADGDIREWEVSNQNTNTIDKLDSGINSRIFAVEHMNIILLQNNKMVFYGNKNDNIELQNKFNIKEGLKLLNVENDNALIMQKGKNLDNETLQLLNLKQQKIIVSMEVSPFSVIEHIDSKTFLVYDDSKGLRLVSFLNGSQFTVQFEEVLGVTCLSAEPVDDKLFLIAIGQRDGIVQLWEASVINEEWFINYKGKSSYQNGFVKNIILVANERKIISTGLDGSIYVAEYDFNMKIRLKNELKLKVNCKNMKIEGLMQERERNILMELSKRQI